MQHIPHEEEHIARRALAEYYGETTEFHGAYVLANLIESASVFTGRDGPDRNGSDTPGAQEVRETSFGECGELQTAGVGLTQNLAPANEVEK